MDKRWIWIILGVFSVVLRFLFAHFPTLTEQVYSRGLFVVIRNAVDYTLGFSPIPLVYFLALFLIGLLIYKIKNRKKGLTIGQRVKQLLFSTVAFVGAIVFFFLFLWGYNYSRIPLEEQIGFEMEPMSIEEIKQELDRNTTLITSLRQEIKGASSYALTDAYYPTDFEHYLREDVKRTFKELGYPTPGRIRGRWLRPKGILLRISTSGVYIPFTSECHIDAGLCPIQVPYILAHEFSHGYGITDEGVCNFLGYLSCIQSENKFIQYSGHLSYWRHLAITYKSYFPEEYAEFRAALPEGILADLNSINEYQTRYPDIMPRYRDMAYDAFLKTQGIEEGIKSYGRLGMLVKAWRKKKGL